MARGDRFFHHPTDLIYDQPEEHGLDYESVFFESRDGTRLHGWFLPAVAPARGTVIHCHGNAGNVTGHYRSVAWLPARGWNVLCFDYRGYGQSQGRPTREGTVLDAHAAIDYARTLDLVDSSRLVLFGQSLGGTVALVVAAQRSDLAAVAVEGAFSSYRSEARFVCRNTWWLWAVSGLVARLFIDLGHDPIDTVDRIGPVPKLFICGTRDGIVDYRETVSLHEYARDPKQLWVIEDGGHTCAFLDDADDVASPDRGYRDRFCTFMTEAVNGELS